ncbi:MAG: carboxymuconolactone decarboxylase family protein [Acidimicrobiales bacterium]
MTAPSSDPHRRVDQPRLAPREERSAELDAALGKTLLRDGRPINIFGTLAHHPALLERFNRFGGYLLNKGLLPAREREIVILRIGARCRSVYEFGQHTVIGERCGLTPAEIAALAGDRAACAAHPWSDDDRALIALADDLCDGDSASDATAEALRRRWSDAEFVELVVVAGFYRLVSGFLNTMGVQLDEGVPSWPS